MMKFVNRYIPSSFRYMLAPITLRFVDSDGLIETLQFLDMCDEDKLDNQTTKFARRTQMLIAKELIRRNVYFWKEM